MMGARSLNNEVSRSFLGKEREDLVTVPDTFRSLLRDWECFLVAKYVMGTNLGVYVVDNMVGRTLKEH